MYLIPLLCISCFNHLYINLVIIKEYFLVNFKITRCDKLFIKEIVGNETNLKVPSSYPAHNLLAVQNIHEGGVALIKHHSGIIHCIH